jgi:hypothetical protein
MQERLYRGPLETLEEVGREGQRALFKRCPLPAMVVAQEDRTPRLALIVIFTALIAGRAAAAGELFPARLGSAVMDEEHLTAARKVALNPVRQAARAEHWRSLA